MKYNGAWERMENPYGELEGFMCECGHQSVAATNYCSNCGRNMSGNINMEKLDPVELAKIAIMQNRLQQAEDELAELKKYHVEKQTEYAGKYQELDKRKEQAEDDNAALREENDIQRQGIQNLSAQVAVLLKELEEYKTSDISKETALTEYYSRAREAERKLEGLRSGLKQIQDYALEFQGLNTDMKEIADMARQALAAEKEESR